MRLPIGAELDPWLQTEDELRSGLYHHYLIWVFVGIVLLIAWIVFGWMYNGTEESQQWVSTWTWWGITLGILTIYLIAWKYIDYQARAEYHAWQDKIDRLKTKFQMSGEAIASYLQRQYSDQLQASSRTEASQTVASSVIAAPVVGQLTSKVL
jgi:type VI protein secretion system component VasK